MNNFDFSSQVDIYDELQYVRMKLEAHDLFPNNQCGATSRLLEELFPQLTGIAGEYTPYHFVSHAWVLDTKSQLLIDMTMDQFNKEHESVMVLPQSTNLLAANEQYTINYHNRKKDPFFKNKVDILKSFL